MNNKFETLFYLLIEEITDEAVKSTQYKKAAEKILELEKSIRAISNNNVNELFNEY